MEVEMVLEAEEGVLEVGPEVAQSLTPFSSNHHDASLKKFSHASW